MGTGASECAVDPEATIEIPVTVIGFSTLEVSEFLHEQSEPGASVPDVVEDPHAASNFDVAA